MSAGGCAERHAMWKRSVMIAAAASAVLLAPGADPAWARSCRVLTPIMPGNQGVLSSIDVVRLASEAFELIDRDRNSVADGEELQGRMSEKELSDDDPDKDGSLDKGEYLVAADARFKLADANQDNVLTCREMRTLAGAAMLRLLAK